MIGVTVAAAFLGRVSLIETGLVVGAEVAPIPTAIVVLGGVAASMFQRAKAEMVDPAVGAIVGAAGDLRAGEPLRSVVAGGAFGANLARRASQGLDLRAGSPDDFAMFGGEAALVAATIEMAVEGGGRVADMFDRLAVGMIEGERTRRERRAAMAPAVAQAVIVGGLPAIVLVQLFVSGRWIDLVSSGSAAAVMVIFGTLAIVIGVVWIIALVSRRAGT